MNPAFIPFLHTYTHSTTPIEIPYKRVPDVRRQADGGERTVARQPSPLCIKRYGRFLSAYTSCVRVCVCVCVGMCGGKIHYKRTHLPSIRVHTYVSYTCAHVHSHISAQTHHTHPFRCHAPSNARAHWALWPWHQCGGGGCRVVTSLHLRRQRRCGNPPRRTRNPHTEAEERVYLLEPSRKTRAPLGREICIKSTGVCSTCSL